MTSLTDNLQGICQQGNDPPENVHLNTCEIHTISNSLNRACNCGFRESSQITDGLGHYTQGVGENAQRSYRTIRSIVNSLHLQRAMGKAGGENLEIFFSERHQSQNNIGNFLKIEWLVKKIVNLQSL